MYCCKPLKTAKLNDVLMSVRAPVGSVNITDQNCCIGRGLTAISAIENISFYKYLFYFFKYAEKDIADMGVGSTFKAICRKDLETIQVPFPPVETQKQIAKALDKASELIEKRKQQIKLLDDFVKSVFIEMFGDPLTNPMGWDIKSFNSIAVIDTKMKTNFDKYKEFPHIGIENIEKDTGKLINYILVKDSNLISGKYVFNKNHIIYSKIRPNLNKVALPEFEGLCSADAYPILPRKEISNKYYIAFILRSEYFLNYILRFSSRTNIPKVNKEQLCKFELPCPPITLQNKFADIVEQTEKQKAQLNDGLGKMEQNYKAIMQKAFNGELFKEDI